MDRLKVVFDPIKVYAFETRTGRVAAVVPYVGQPSWSFGLNQAGGWRVDVPTGTAELGNELLSGIADPWRFSWAIAQGSDIWQAGPVISETCDEDSNISSISGAGIWRLLSDKRLLVNPGRAALDLVTPIDADVAFGTGSVSSIGSPIPGANQNVSLHTIAKRIMQIITTETGGDLPIVYPADIAGTAERTYPGFELASPGQRLFELTQVLGGPEIEFRPEFVDPVTKQQVQWRMRIGDDQTAGGRLGNIGFPHAWDYGSFGALVKVGFSVDGMDRVTRDFERGNGMDRAALFGFYDAPIGADSAALLLEHVGNDHTSTTDVGVLSGWARAEVLSNQSTPPSLTATVRIPGDNGLGEKTRSPSLPEVSVGDNAYLVIRKHRRIVDGTYAVRIIGMSSVDRPQFAALQLQSLGRVQ